jgi:hypothetical protein
MYRIPESNMGWLREKIEKLAARAKKLGSPPITLETHEYEDEEQEDGSIIRYWNVTIEGEAPRLKGWRFVGKIVFTPEGNVLQTLPEQEEYGDVPEWFRTCEPWCDHCDLNRLRITTYIVANEEEEYKQIGSTCLADFTGHANPEWIVQTAKLIWEATAECQEAEGFDPDYVGGQGHYLSTERYLSMVAACVRENGWVPRSKRDYAHPTADEAISQMFYRQYIEPRHRIDPGEEDIAVAKETIEWAREDLSKRERLSDYEWNLSITLADSVMPWRLNGIAASAISVYKREKERLATLGGSEYQGEVGKRTTFRGLTLISIYSFEGGYGVTNLHKFQDAEGNILVWFTGKRLEEDAVYGGKATVKKHDEYKGVKQTTLTRCKFEEEVACQPVLL